MDNTKSCTVLSSKFHKKDILKPSENKVLPPLTKNVPDNLSKIFEKKKLVGKGLYIKRSVSPILRPLQPIRQENNYKFALLKPKKKKLKKLAALNRSNNALNDKIPGKPALGDDKVYSRLKKTLKIGLERLKPLSRDNPAHTAREILMFADLKEPIIKSDQSSEIRAWDYI